MRTPPTFPGKRRVAMVADGLYMSPAARERFAEVATRPVDIGQPWQPEWSWVQKFEDRSLPAGAWVLWLDGKMTASGTIPC